MLTIISPAKTLDFDSPLSIAEYTIPAFLNDSEYLIHLLRSMKAEEISLLMNISPKLAVLNERRYRSWHKPFTPDNARQALFTFRGDVYSCLDAESMGVHDIGFAQNHLRILSGLYGLLRPLDLMQPYRLEMGTQLANSRGRTLYAFWGDMLTQALNTVFAGQESRVLVNLASSEYFKAILPAGLKAKIITPIFKEQRGEGYKVVSLYAKRARGMVARHIISELLDNSESLKAFNIAGYVYRPDLSTDSDWIFTRKSE